LIEKEGTAVAKTLSGKVALVTGGSRGIGKGIALELGAAGATVYVTGRSVDTTASAAAELTELGGTGIPAQCDHTDDAEVEALFDRVRSEQGRLDILVNNAADVNKILRWNSQPFGDAPTPVVPFWQQTPQAWTDVVEGGARNTFVSSLFASRIMVEQGSGFIANVSARGAVTGGPETYLFSVVHGMSKAATDKLTSDIAIELGPLGICTASLWPGMVATEAAEQHAATMHVDLEPVRPFLESPRFTGRAVVALATDPLLATARSGRAWIVAELARDYGFVDIDGNEKPIIRNHDELMKLHGFGASV
jgi:NAD(P)-dependent dehydrogenase (short-subunit alcohol dehydrogenase family)